VYPGRFVRSAVRRAKQSLFRRQRVPVEIPPDESAAQDEAEDDRDAEKIEVHVHLHRGEGSRSRSRRARPPVLTGALFDSQWYMKRIRERPRETVSSRWSLVARCESCDSLVPSSASRCPRCAAPRARRILPTILALLGIGSVVAVVLVCAHVLGDSVPERKAPTPLGQWSDDGEYMIVEVPSSPSPFSGSTSPASGSGSPGGTAK